jgi:predicted PurR-regulated permease PerM
VVVVEVDIGCSGCLSPAPFARVAFYWTTIYHMSVSFGGGRTTLPMSDPVKSAETTSDRGMRVSIGLCTAVIVVTALYFSGPVFAPLAFALLIIAVIWPVQNRLQTRLPKLAALAVSMLVTIVILAAFVSLVAWGFGRVGRFIVREAARFQSLYGQMAEWLEGHGIAVAGLWAEHFNVGWLISLFQQVTTRLNSTLTFSLVVLIYVILGLLEVDVAATKLRAVQTGEFGRVLLTGGAETAAKFRRYLLVRTLMSVTTGLLVWGFAALVGLPLPAEWGVIAFALNYIPFIGPFIATVFPTLFAIAQFESWQMAVIVFACLNLIQFLVGSYLEPRIAGSALSISPFLVLFAVFFWTFVWGIAGAFIGVPIVIAALTLCEQHPSSRWIADLLGGPGEEKA